MNRQLKVWYTMKCVHVSLFVNLGVNMGYMDNSYSNSNNGGSVNSQDSIWQMKSQAANGVNPPYDLGGYATTESDYPAHQHYMPQREDYRESHNLSRQQFCPEPFATVVESQKRVGQYTIYIFSYFVYFVFYFSF